MPKVKITTECRPFIGGKGRLKNDIVDVSKEELEILIKNNHAKKMTSSDRQDVMGSIRDE